LQEYHLKVSFVFVLAVEKAKAKPKPKKKHACKNAAGELKANTPNVKTEKSKRPLSLSPAHTLSQCRAVVQGVC